MEVPAGPLCKITKCFILFIGSLLINSILSYPQQSSGKEYPLRLQPELDILDVESYLRNSRLLKLQINCILYNGPCDVVGKWAKPRVKAGLLGECLMCTEKQKGWLNFWLEKLINEQPELYRSAIAKFIHNSGIELNKEEIDRITKNIEQGIITAANPDSKLN